MDNEIYYSSFSGKPSSHLFQSSQRPGILSSHHGSTTIENVNIDLHRSSQRKSLLDAPEMGSNLRNFTNYPSISVSYNNAVPKKKTILDSSPDLNRDSFQHSSVYLKDDILPVKSSYDMTMIPSNQDSVQHSANIGIVRSSVPGSVDGSSVISGDQGYTTRKSALTSTLEKYFSSEEIRRFNEYNRFLVMSSPERQKKFYSSLTSTEYKRFCDFLDFDTAKQSNASTSISATLPAPQIKTPNQPKTIVVNTDTDFERTPRQYSSSYSYYYEDKISKPVAKFKDDSLPTRSISSSALIKKPLLPHQSVSMFAEKEQAFYEHASDLTPNFSGYSHERENQTDSKFSQNTRRGESPQYIHRSTSNATKASRESHSPSRSRSPSVSKRSSRSKEKSRSKSGLHNLAKLQSINESKLFFKKVKHYKIKMNPYEFQDYLKQEMEQLKKTHNSKLHDLNVIKRREHSSSDKLLLKEMVESLKGMMIQISHVQRELNLNNLILNKFKKQKAAQADSGANKKEELSKLSVSKKTKPVEKKPVSSSKKPSTCNDSNTNDGIKAKKPTTTPPAKKGSKRESELSKLGTQVKKFKSSLKEGESKSNLPANEKSEIVTKQTAKSKLARAKPSTESTRKELSGSKVSETRPPPTAVCPTIVTDDEINAVIPNYQWCSLCNVFFESTNEFLVHLHCDNHVCNLKNSDYQILKRAEEKLDNVFRKQLGLKANKSDEEPNLKEFLGTEFMYPSKSFYCDLCAMFTYTKEQTNHHLRSEKHLNLYKKYLQKNAEYETKYFSKCKTSFKESYLMRQMIRKKINMKTFKIKDQLTSNHSKSSQSKSNVVSEVKKTLDSIITRVIALVEDNRSSKTTTKQSPKTVKTQKTNEKSNIDSSKTNCKILKNSNVKNNDNSLATKNGIISSTIENSNDTPIDLTVMTTNRKNDLNLNSSNLKSVNSTGSNSSVTSETQTQVSKMEDTNAFSDKSSNSNGTNDADYNSTSNDDNFSDKSDMCILSELCTSSDQLVVNESICQDDYENAFGDEERDEEKEEEYNSVGADQEDSDIDDDPSLDEDDGFDVIDEVQ